MRGEVLLTQHTLLQEGSAQALALLQVWRNESSMIGFVGNISLIFLFLPTVSAWCGSFDSAYLIAGGFGFGAAPASTGAAAGLER